ncbi:hypothetical protein HZP84_16355 [Elizabethkingia anophelis]|nr:hypothetical protein [Elizabethkingia anophelis]MCT3824613.1 hypothetical protein [Elizabethkingia anophelis]MCT3931906.1 hypothetical protein [Elizabethkingia anophelis]MCT4078035.1 hypothetical protein [Elizabethkingia anophelis]MCT4081700.1 hypothetical protein [Elizabethkingia anophelis]
MVSSIQRYDNNFHRYVLERPESNFEIDILLTSDWHFDNPKTDREMLFNHLDEVKKRNGYIIVNGDLLCLMMGKYDPRGSKSGIRPEHNGDNYLDLVINDTAEKLIPYAHNILQINKGNHETAVSKRSETDVLERLVERINAKAGSNIQLGAYTGFITLCLMRSGGTKHSCKIGYSHGNWGGVVTKGALSVQRYASFLDGADIIMSGHCFDEDTEILTSEGWIKHDKITNSTCVATMNLQSKKMEYQYINSIHRYSNYNKLYSIQAEGIDIMTTSEHGLVLEKRRTGDIIKCTTENFVNQKEVSIYNSTYGYTQSSLNINDDLLKLSSWIISDGSIDNGSIRFHFKKERKINRVCELLNNAKIPYSKNINKNGNCKINIPKSNSIEIIEVLGIKNKHFSPIYYLLDDRQSKLILDEYKYADGSVSKKGDCYVLYSNNLHDLSVLQSMCVKNGLKATIHNENETRGTSRLNVSSRSKTYFAKGRYNEVEYSGSVWCVNVDNGTLIVRRNGKVSVTQNTHDRWVMEFNMLSANSTKGIVENKTQYHVKTGTYKEEFVKGEGWATEKIGMPKSLGSVWCKIIYSRNEGLQFEFTPTRHKY